MKHEQLKGIIPMRPGYPAGASCSCGWHSHHLTFDQHMTNVMNGADPDDDNPDQGVHRFDGGGAW